MNSSMAATKNTMDFLLEYSEEKLIHRIAISITRKDILYQPQCSNRNNEKCKQIRYTRTE